MFKSGMIIDHLCVMQRRAYLDMSLVSTAQRQQEDLSSASERSECTVLSY